MHEIVMEYRRKLASLTQQNKRIWDLAHTMLHEMMRSENADIQGNYVSCRRHGDASRAAENELLELLATPASTGEAGLKAACQSDSEIYEQCALIAENSHLNGNEPSSNACLRVAANIRKVALIINLKDQQAAALLVMGDCYKCPACEMPLSGTPEGHLPDCVVRKATETNLKNAGWTSPYEVSTGEANGWPTGIEIHNRFCGHEGNICQACQLKDAAPTNVPQEEPPKKEK
jgi:hypothetical protein